MRASTYLIFKNASLQAMKIYALLLPQSRGHKKEIAGVSAWCEQHGQGLVLWAWRAAEHHPHGPVALPSFLARELPPHACATTLGGRKVRGVSGTVQRKTASGLNSTVNH